MDKQDIAEEAYKNGYEQGAKDAAEKITQAIVDNTYPYFDKDGKPVNIWKAKEGYNSIDEIAKGLTE